MRESSEQIPQDILAICNTNQQLKEPEVYTVQIGLFSKATCQGKVFLVTRNLDWYAAKIFIRVSDFQRQVSVLTQLSNAKHTVKIFRYIQNAEVKLSNNSTSLTRPVLIMQYLQHGQLLRFYDLSIIYHYRTQGKKLVLFPIKICKAILYQLLSAVLQIHNNGVLHRDIKLENILIDKNFNIRLIDFGLSAKMSDQNVSQNENPGTPGFRAPQVYKLKKYYKQSDVFSCGVVFFYLCFYSIPFTQKGYPTTQQLHYYDDVFGQNGNPLKIWQNLQINYKQLVTQELKHFFKYIFAENFNSRISIQEIFDSQFMKDRSSEQQLQEFLQQQCLKFTDKMPDLQNFYRDKIKTNRMKEKQKQIMRIQYQNQKKRKQRNQKLREIKNRVLNKYNVMVNYNNRSINSFNQSLYVLRIDQNQYQKQSGDYNIFNVSKNIYENRAFGLNPQIITQILHYQLFENIKDESLTILCLLGKDKKMGQVYVNTVGSRIQIELQVVRKADNQYCYSIQAKGEFLIRDSDFRYLIRWHRQANESRERRLLLIDLQWMLAQLSQLQKQQQL